MIKESFNILLNDKYPTSERLMVGCFLGIYLSLLSFIAIALVVCCFASERYNNETGWSFSESYPLHSYKITTIQINGHPSAGDNSEWGDDTFCNDYYSNCDVIGAFVERDGNEICVGGAYTRNSINNVPTMINVNGALILDDECLAYCDQIYPGEIPYFKVFDHTTGIIDDLDIDGIQPFSGYADIFLDYGSVDYEILEGDLNLDGDVNVLDTIILINIILEED